MNRKLCPLFSGTYLVVEVKSPYIYKVVDQKSEMILHHDKLREILGEPLPVERPENHLDQEEVVEQRPERNNVQPEDDWSEPSDSEHDIAQEEEASDEELELSLLFEAEPLVTRRGQLVKRPWHFFQTLFKVHRVVYMFVYISQ